MRGSFSTYSNSFATLQWSTITLRLSPCLLTGKWMNSANLGWQLAKYDWKALPSSRHLFENTRCYWHLQHEGRDPDHRPLVKRTWVCRVNGHCSVAQTQPLEPRRQRCPAGHTLWQWDRGHDGHPLEQRLPTEGFYQPVRWRPNHQRARRKTRHLSWYVRCSHPTENGRQWNFVSNMAK